MKALKTKFIIIAFSVMAAVPRIGVNFNQNNLQIARIEADYIVSCQMKNNSNVAFGAINNIHGQPTWVVPRENALAILGLLKATELLATQAQENNYRYNAEIAANYLVRIQESDGAWCDQYSYTHEVIASKSPTQTAEVMIAFYKLGMNETRYLSMYRGAEFLMACQDPANKGGNDDGLLGGGKDENGNYNSWRWCSDNAFAYQALRAAGKWAERRGDLAFAAQCFDSASQIIEGINQYLYIDDPEDENFGVWLRVVDENSQIIPEQNYSDWINYAPQMLDLPAEGVGSEQVGIWIHNNLQADDGACVWDDQEYSQRKSPGYSFQASLCWIDLKQNRYANLAKNWALASELWQKNADPNGIIGGWIDWVEPEDQADWWLRFIDTSFYAIAVFNGGYNFNIE